MNKNQILSLLKNGNLNELKKFKEDFEILIKEKEKEKEKIFDFYEWYEKNKRNNVFCHLDFYSQAFVSGESYKLFPRTEVCLIQNKVFLERIIKETIKFYNKGWTPNWENLSSSKFYFYYIPRQKEIAIENSYYCKTFDNGFYMKSKKVAKKVLNSLKDNKIGNILYLYFSEDY